MYITIQAQGCRVGPPAWRHCCGVLLLAGGGPESLTPRLLWFPRTFCSIHLRFICHCPVCAVFRWNFRSLTWCLFVFWHLQWTGSFAIYLSLCFSSWVPLPRANGHLIMVILASLSNILLCGSYPEAGRRQPCWRGSWLWALCTLAGCWSQLLSESLRSRWAVQSHIKGKALLCGA